MIKQKKQKMDSMPEQFNEEDILKALKEDDNVSIAM